MVARVFDHSIKESVTDLCEFEDTLVYIVSYKATRAVRPCLRSINKIGLKVVTLKSPDLYIFLSAWLSQFQFLAFRKTHVQHYIKTRGCDSACLSVTPAVRR